MGAVAGIGGGVGPRELGDLGAKASDVGPKHHVAAVGERRDLGRERQHLEAEARQLEVQYDLRLQEAHDMGGRGDLVARPQLFCDRGTADDVAPLESTDGKTGLGEIAPTDEPVVTAADDHDVKCIDPCAPERFS